MSDHNVAYNGRVWVRGEKCDACLYSPDRIVPGSRARDLTAATRAEEGSTFICHKGQVSDEPTSICRGWWDSFAEEDHLLRAALAMGLVSYVKVGKT